MPFFVDWLTVSQTYAVDLPLVDAGVVVSVDADGVPEWRTSKSVAHAGSYETSVNLKCDGHRVTFSGNVSRFGRPDNLFGYSFTECMRRVNELLECYGLPPFSGGQRMERITRGDVRYEWTGARVSRIDLTANYESGSESNAHAVMQYLGEQHANRKAGRVLGDGQTVDWGRGSRRQYWKAYIKHAEMLHHKSTAIAVIEHCRSRGIIRFEGTVRSNALTDIGAAYLADYERGWAMGQLVQLFETQSEVLSRAQRASDGFDDLPRALRGVARDYLAGMDMPRVMSRSRFYVARRELLAFGIDIAVRNVRPFSPRRQVIQLVPAAIPEWYELAA